MRREDTPQRAAADQARGSPGDSTPLLALQELRGGFRGDGPQSSGSKEDSGMGTTTTRSSTELCN